jgi:hypothetical protein
LGDPTPLPPHQPPVEPPREEWAKTGPTRGRPIHVGRPTQGLLGWARALVRWKVDFESFE